MIKLVKTNILDTESNFNDVTITSLSSKYKVLENNDNHFTILNVKQSLEPLIVICRNTNDNSVTEIHIELGGLI